MSIEDVKSTSHVRDMIVSRLDPAVREAYHRASQKAWRGAMKNEEVSYSAEETSAVELVEQRLLDKLRHRRHKRERSRISWF